MFFLVCCPLSVVCCPHCFPLPLIEGKAAQIPDSGPKIKIHLLLAGTVLAGLQISCQTSDANFIPFRLAANLVPKLAVQISCQSGLDLRILENSILMLSRCQLNLTGIRWLESRSNFHHATKVLQFGKCFTIKALARNRTWLEPFREGYLCSQTSLCNQG